MEVPPAQLALARRVVAEVQRATSGRAPNTWRAPIPRGTEPGLEWKCFEYYSCILQSVLAIVPVGVGRGHRTHAVFGRGLATAYEQTKQHLLNISIPKFYIKYRRHVSVETGWWTKHGLPDAFVAHIKRFITSVREAYKAHRHTAELSARAGAGDTGNHVENLAANFGLMPSNHGVHTVALTRELISMCREVEEVHTALASYTQITSDQAARKEAERQVALNMTTQVVNVTAERQKQRNRRLSTGSVSSTLQMSSSTQSAPSTDLEGVSNSDGSRTGHDPSGFVNIIAETARRESEANTGLLQLRTGLEATQAEQEATKAEVAATKAELQALHSKFDHFSSLVASVLARIDGGHGARTEDTDTGTGGKVNERSGESGEGGLRQSKRRRRK